jgi:hypothetical protein
LHSPYRMLSCANISRLNGLSASGELRRRIARRTVQGPAPPRQLTLQSSPRRRSASKPIAQRHSEQRLPCESVPPTQPSTQPRPMRRRRPSRAQRGSRTRTGIGAARVREGCLPLGEPTGTGDSAKNLRSLCDDPYVALPGSNPRPLPARSVLATTGLGPCGLSPPEHRVPPRPYLSWVEGSTTDRDVVGSSPRSSV